MKTKIIILGCLMVCIGMLCNAQNTKSSRTNNSKQDAYKTLMQRYNAGDTTLTVNDYATIYYGFANTDDYNGSMGYGEEDVDDLMASENYTEALNSAREILQRCPVSLKGLNQYLSAAIQLKTPENELIPYIHHFFGLLSAIAASGDGHSKRTAYAVICVNDEYEILKFLEVKELKSQELVDQKYDVFTFGSSPHFDGNTIYFDISRSFDHMKRMFR